MQRGFDRQYGLYGALDIAEEKNLAEANPERMKGLSDLLDGWEDEMCETAEPFPSPSTGKRKK